MLQESLTSPNRYIPHLVSLIRKLRLREVKELPEVSQLEISRL